MAQRGDSAGFVLEPAPTIRIRQEHGGKNLDRNIASEPWIASAIHLTHPAGADGRNDFIATNTGTCRKAHLVGIICSGCRSSRRVNQRTARDADHSDPAQLSMAHRCCGWARAFARTLSSSKSRQSCHGASA
jgi:hypothetical protein